MTTSLYIPGLNLVRYSGKRKGIFGEDNKNRKDTSKEKADF